jgi:TolB-like protein
MAIMPFIALNRNDDDEAFADGLTDEIIYLMSRSPGFRVIARSSIFQYKSQPFSAAELTQKFAVQAVVQGTVRRSGNRFRVTVELSGPDGYVVWSDRFEAEVSEYFRLQEQIAAALVSRCRLDVSQMRAMHLQPSPLALKSF